MSGSVDAGRARATLLTGVAQLAVLLGAAALGILIARRFETGPATDGFFTANAIYAIALFVGQSLRTTAVSGLMVDRHPSVAAYRVHLRAIGLLGLLAGALFALAALVVVPLAAGDLPGTATDTSRRALAILWPAAVLQLAGGLTAAMLAVLDDYRTPALAYGAGAAGNVLAFALLVGPLGIDAVPVALLSGSLISTGWMGLALRRGLRGAKGEATPAASPAQPDGHAPTPRSAPHLAARLLLGAVSLVAAQLVISASVAFAATAGAGDATVFSYAQMGIAVLAATLISPVTVVFAPVVARDWDDDPRTLGDLSERALRAGAMALPVAVAGLCLIGPAPARELLTGFSRDEVDELFALVLALSPSLIAAQLVMIPLLGVLTRERFGSLAAWSLAVAAVHIGLTFAATKAFPDDLTAIAVVADVSSFGLAAVATVLALGRHTRTLVAGAARAYTAIAAPGAIAFAAAALALRPEGDFAEGLLAFVLGLIAHAAWLALGHRDEARGLLASLIPRGT